MSFYKNPHPGTVVIGNTFLWRVVMKNEGGYIYYETNSTKGWCPPHTACNFSTWEQWCKKNKAVPLDTFLDRYKKIDNDLKIANWKLEQLEKRKKK